MRKRGPNRKNPICLSESQRAYLKAFIKSGPARARETLRARIILDSDESTGTPESVSEIAEFYDVSPVTVRAICERFTTEGLEAALYDKPRPGQPERLSGEQKAKVIALTCSNPPDSHERWTIRLLTDKVIELGIADSVGRETIRQVLKKTN